MPKIIETVIVKDAGLERAVQVTIDAPAIDIQAFAQRAWLTAGGARRAVTLRNPR